MIRRLLVSSFLAASLAVAACGGTGDSQPAEAPEAAAPGGAESPAADGGAAPAPAAAETPSAAAPPADAAKPAGRPVVVVDTAKGVFEFEMYPEDAPKTVEHILTLVKRNFYNGQRVHRVEPGFVVQFGDPASRDMRLRQTWGNGGSGRPVGVAEITRRRTHRTGAVAMAHAGIPSLADSQMYVVLDTARASHLDGGYTVFGQVISGMDVVRRLQELDVIKKVSLKAETPAATN